MNGPTQRKSKRGGPDTADDDALQAPKMRSVPQKKSGRRAAEEQKVPEKSARSSSSAMEEMPIEESSHKSVKEFASVDEKKKKKKKQSVTSSNNTNNSTKYASNLPTAAATTSTTNTSSNLVKSNNNNNMSRRTIDGIAPPQLRHASYVRPQPGAVAITGDRRQYRGGFDGDHPNEDDVSTLENNTDVTAPTRIPSSSMMTDGQQSGFLSTLTSESSPIIATVVSNDGRDAPSHNSENANYKSANDIPCGVLMRDRRIMTLFLVCLLIIAGLAAGLAISLTSGKESSGGADSSDGQGGMIAPTIAPTQAFVGQSLQDFFISISSDEGAAILFSNSPQRLALYELENDPQIESYSDDRLQQKYALQTMRYSIIQKSDGSDIALLSSSRQRLRRLDDINNECSWLFVTCDDFDQVTSFKIENYQYLFTLPDELALLTNLQVLNFNNNQAFGTIPSVLSKLNRLTQFQLVGNFFTGTIATEFAAMPKLDSIRLSYNELFGTIPSEFGQSTTLHQIDLTENKLTGTIPTELFANRDLCYLFLGRNLLIGTIPTEVGSYPILKLLHAHNNDLTGSLPTEMARMSDLNELRIHDNKLAGTIPAFLGNLPIRDLHLDYNDFVGTIPVALTALTDMWGTLSLGGNQLTGTIPTELGRLRGLANLGLGLNQLVGTIPSQLGFLTSIGTLHVCPKLEHADFVADKTICEPHRN